MKIKLILIFFSILVLAFGLRIYKIASIPPGLYWDEAAMALDAKSIAQTGKDQHGHSLLQPIYPSWGDYKLPAYIITAVPFFKIIKNNPELAIRLPSVIAGTLTIFIVYFLTKELFQIKNQNKNPQLLNYSITNYLPLTAMLLMAISPWHLQFSRVAFEGNLALLFNSLALLFFLKFRKKLIFVIPSLFFSVLGIYTYYSSRIILPSILFLSFLMFFKKSLKNILTLTFLLLLISLCVSPLQKSSLAPQAEQFRLSTKNIMNDTQIIGYSSYLIEQDDKSWLSRKIHHRFFYQAKVLIGHYFDHFSLNYLLLSGDPNLRHSTGRIGVMLVAGFIGLLLGEYYLFLKNKKIFVFLNLCLFISFLPACVPYEVPHSLRALNGVIFLNIISAYGLVLLAKKLFVKKYFILLFLILCLLFGQFLFYLHDYYIHYSPRSYYSWQSGYKEAVKIVNDNFDQIDEVIFTNLYARPYLYFLLYSDYPLAKFQEQRKKLLQKEPLNYQETFIIDKIGFRSLRPEDLAVDQLKKILIIASPQELGVEAGTPLNPTFTIWKNY